MIPVLTRYLAPADYGVTATFQVLVGFVAPFIGLSIQGAVARKYFDKGSVDFPAYVTNCLFVLLGSSLVASLIILIAARPIARLAVFPHQWIWAVLAVSVSQFIAQVTLTLWQVQSMPLKYGLFQSLQTIINLILSLWFVIGLRMSWGGGDMGSGLFWSFFRCDGHFHNVEKRLVKAKI